MGWFDEQIKERNRADQKAFDEAFLRIASAVTGKRLSEILGDDSLATREALHEIMYFYHIVPSEVPNNIDKPEDEMEYLLRPHGIMHREVELTGEWFEDATGAMLAVRSDDGSVIALIPGHLGGYTFYDNKLGRRVKVTTLNEHLIKKKAIAFYKPLPMRKIGMHDLMIYAAENIYRSDVVIYVTMLVLTTITGMIITSLTKRIFGEVIDYGQTIPLLAIGVFLTLVQISMILFELVEEIVLVRVSTRLDINLQAATMMRILSLPSDFFRKFSAGELAGRSEYIAMIINSIFNSGLSAIFTAVISLTYLIQISFYASFLVIPALIITLIKSGITLLAVYMQIPITKEHMETSAKEQGLSYAMISGIHKIKLSGAEKRAFAKWGEIYARMLRHAYNPPTFLKIYPVLNTAVSTIGTIVLYVISYKNGISAADYIAFTTGFAFVSGALSSLTTAVATIAKLSPVIDMAKPIFETEPEISQDKQVIQRLSGSIELNNVTFRYSSEMPPVIDKLSLKIKPGEYVAIVGKTGCGKSTLLRLLLGFEEPEKGGIFYDGKDLSSIDLKSLRQKIGTVMQNGSLFTGDIYSNIAVAAPGLSIDDAWEAARKAGLADDIRKMPMGMATLVAEDGSNMSGGQKQRILIARAIAGNPRILMFDEATSSLDNTTQKHVCDALDKLKCTRIIIAHRLSTIRQCSRIILLENGNIKEEGTYDELMALGGAFYELVKDQTVVPTIE